MSSSLNVSGKLHYLLNTVYFFKKHFHVVLGLGLVAALGRVFQLGGFGPITLWMNIVLEIVVESARLILVVYVLGLANVRNGVLRIRRLFTDKANRKTNWHIAVKNLKTEWLFILVNIIGFFIVAWALNYLVDLVAYETCLYLKLKEDGILNASSSEWTILLFFKNLSVIPFTLVFETLLILSITNRLGNYSTKRI